MPGRMSAGNRNILLGRCIYVYSLSTYGSNYFYVQKKFKFEGNYRRLLPNSKPKHRRFFQLKEENFHNILYWSVDVLFYFLFIIDN